MAKTLAPDELKALQRIHKMMLALEQSLAFAPDKRLPLAPDATDASAMATVKLALAALAGSANPELQKLADISRHLNNEMTPKQFSTWIVPIERALGRQLRDDQFLIHTDDAAEVKLEKIPLVFVLDNLRSAFNVGSIFRTAECFGVSKIYLAGYTPLPDQEKLTKTAMGTADLVEWEAAPKITELLKKLSTEGFEIIAFETTSHAVEVQQEFSELPTAFVFGNERFGLENDILNLCSEVRKIPLRGRKNSLNVGVAAAIATYEFTRQYNLKSSAHE